MRREMHAVGAMVPEAEWWGGSPRFIEVYAFTGKRDDKIVAQLTSREALALASRLIACVTMRKGTLDE